MLFLIITALVFAAGARANVFYYDSIDVKRVALAPEAAIFISKATSHVWVSVLPQHSNRFDCRVWIATSSSDVALSDDVEIGILLPPQTDFYVNFASECTSTFLVDTGPASLIPVPDSIKISIDPSYLKISSSASEVIRDRVFIDGLITRHSPEQCSIPISEIYDPESVMVRTDQGVYRIRMTAPLVYPFSVSNVTLMEFEGAMGVFFDLPLDKFTVFVDLVDQNGRYVVGVRADDKKAVALPIHPLAESVNITVLVDQVPVAHSSHPLRASADPPVWSVDTESLFRITCPLIDLEYNQTEMQTIPSDHAIDVPVTWRVNGQRVFPDAIWLAELDSGLMLDVTPPSFPVSTRFGEPVKSVRVHMIIEGVRCSSGLLFLDPPPHTVVHAIVDDLGIPDFEPNSARVAIGSNLPSLPLPVFVSMSTATLELETVRAVGLGYVHIYRVSNANREHDFVVRIPFYPQSVTLSLPPPRISPDAPSAKRVSSSPILPLYLEPRRVASTENPVIVPSLYHAHTVSVLSLEGDEIGIIGPTGTPVTRKDLIPISETTSESVFVLPSAGMYVLLRNGDALFAYTQPGDKYLDSMIDWTLTTTGEQFSVCKITAQRRWPLRIAVNPDVLDQYSSVTCSMHWIADGKTGMITSPNLSKSMPSWKYSAEQSGTYAMQLVLTNAEGDTVIHPVGVVELKDNSNTTWGLSVLQHPTCRDSNDGRVALVPPFARESEEENEQMTVLVTSCILLDGHTPCPVFPAATGLVLESMPFVSSLLATVYLGTRCSVVAAVSFVPSDADYPSGMHLEYAHTCSGGHYAVVAPRPSAATYRPSHSVQVDPLDPRVAVTVSHGLGPQKCEQTLHLRVDKLFTPPSLRLVEFQPVFCPDTPDAQIRIAFSPPLETGLTLLYNGKELDPRFISRAKGQIIMYDASAGVHLFGYRHDDCLTELRVVIDEKRQFAFINRMLIAPALDGAWAELQNSETNEIASFNTEMLEPDDAKYLETPTRFAGLPNGHSVLVDVPYPDSYIRHAGQLCPSPAVIRVPKLYSPPQNTKRSEHRYAFTLVAPPPLVQTIQSFDKLDQLDGRASLVVRSEGKQRTWMQLSLPEAMRAAECKRKLDSFSCVLRTPEELVGLGYTVIVKEPTVPVSRFLAFPERGYLHAVIASDHIPGPVTAMSTRVFVIHHTIPANAEMVVYAHNPARQLITGCMMNYVDVEGWTSRCTMRLSPATIRMSDFALTIVIRTVQDMQLVCKASTNTVTVLISGGQPPFYISGLESNALVTHERAVMRTTKQSVHMIFASDSADVRHKNVLSCFVRVEAEETADFGIAELVIGPPFGCSAPYQFSVEAVLSRAPSVYSHVRIGADESDQERIVDCNDARMESRRELQVVISQRSLEPRIVVCVDDKMASRTVHLPGSVESDELRIHREGASVVSDNARGELHVHSVTERDTETTVVVNDDRRCAVWMDIPKVEVQVAEKEMVAEKIDEITSVAKERRSLMLNATSNETQSMSASASAATPEPVTDRGFMERKFIFAMSFYLLMILFSLVIAFFLFMQ